jgi:hypothetical protein
VPADRAATVALPLELAAAPRGVALDPDVELLGTVELRAARGAP